MSLDRPNDMDGPHRSNTSAPPNHSTQGFATSWASAQNMQQQPLNGAMNIGFAPMPHGQFMPMANMHAQQGMLPYLPMVHGGGGAVHGGFDAGAMSMGGHGGQYIQGTSLHAGAPAYTPAGAPAGSGGGGSLLGLAGTGGHAHTHTHTHTHALQGASAMTVVATSSAGMTTFIGPESDRAWSTFTQAAHIGKYTLQGKAGKGGGQAKANTPTITFDRMELSPPPAARRFAKSLKSEACFVCLHNVCPGDISVLGLTCCASEQQGNPTCTHAAHFDCVSQRFWANNLGAPHPPATTYVRATPVRLSMLTNALQAGMDRGAGAPRSAGTLSSQLDPCVLDISVKHLLSDGKMLEARADGLRAEVVAATRLLGGAGEGDYMLRYALGEPHAQDSHRRAQGSGLQLVKAAPDSQRDSLQGSQAARLEAAFFHLEGSCVYLPCTRGVLSFTFTSGGARKSAWSGSAVYDLSEVDSNGASLAAGLHAQSGQEVPLLTLSVACPGRVMVTLLLAAVLASPGSEEGVGQAGEDHEGGLGAPVADQLASVIGNSAPVIDSYVILGTLVDVDINALSGVAGGAAPINTSQSMPMHREGSTPMSGAGTPASRPDLSIVPPPLGSPHAPMQGEQPLSGSKGRYTGPHPTTHSDTAPVSNTSDGHPASSEHSHPSGTPTHTTTPGSMPAGSSASSGGAPYGYGGWNGGQQSTGYQQSPHGYPDDRTGGYGEYRQGPGQQGGVVSSPQQRTAPGAAYRPGQGNPRGGRGGPGDPELYASLERSRNPFASIRHLSPQIIGHIKSQKGSKFLQDCLRQLFNVDRHNKALGAPGAEAEEAADYILERVLYDLPQLVIDLFGNYFVQALYCCANQSQRERMLARLEEHMTIIGLDKTGNLALQTIVDWTEPTNPAEVDILRRGLEKDVTRLMVSQQACHVILKFMRRMPPRYAEFVHNAVQHDLAGILCSEWAGEIVRATIEQAEPLVRSRLVAFILRNAVALAQHPFGHRTLLYLLDSRNRTQRLLFFPGLVEVLSNKLVCTPAAELTGGNQDPDNGFGGLQPFMQIRADVFPAHVRGKVTGLRPGWVAHGGYSCAPNTNAAVIAENARESGEDILAGAHPLYDDEPEAIKELWLSAALCRALRGRVVQLVQKPHAALIVQRAVVLGAMERRFALEELFVVGGPLPPHVLERLSTPAAAEASSSGSTGPAPSLTGSTAQPDVDAIAAAAISGDGDALRMAAGDTGTDRNASQTEDSEAQLPPEEPGAGAHLRYLLADEIAANVIREILRFIHARDVLRLVRLIRPHCESLPPPIAGHWSDVCAEEEARAKLEIATGSTGAREDAVERSAPHSSGPSGFGPSAAASSNRFAAAAKEQGAGDGAAFSGQHRSWNGNGPSDGAVMPSSDRLSGSPALAGAFANPGDRMPRGRGGAAGGSYTRGPRYAGGGGYDRGSRDVGGYDGGYNGGADAAGPSSGSWSSHGAASAPRGGGGGGGGSRYEPASTPPAGQEGGAYGSNSYANRQGTSRPSGSGSYGGYGGYSEASREGSSTRENASTGRPSAQQGAQLSAGPSGKGFTPRGGGYNDGARTPYGSRY